MPAYQALLFPDPRPLVERLGRDFFRRLPEDPGVYLMLHGKMPDPLVLPRGAGTLAVVASLDRLFRGQTEAFGHWIRAQMPDPLQPFAKALLEADLACVTDAFTHA